MKPAFKFDSPETGATYWSWVESSDVTAAPGPRLALHFMTAGRLMPRQSDRSGCGRRLAA